MTTEADRMRASADHEAWTLNPGSALLPYECTMAGITERCHGGCCWNRGYWPPSSSGVPRAACPRLGPTGCTLAEARPIVCHLFPLVVSDRGTLMVDPDTRWVNRGVCKGNRGREGAPLLIDVVRPGLVQMFGAAAFAEARALVVAGKAARLVLTDGLRAALRAEADAAEVNAVPVARKET